MTSSTLSPPGTGVGRRPHPVDAAYVLAFVAPLLLFVHGILLWVDALDDPDALRPPDLGPLSVVAGAVLVAAVAGFAWLTVALSPRAEHLSVGVPAGLLAAFGAGATGAVWAGQSVGVLDESIPPALAVGGPVLVGIALAIVLGALTIEARMPVGALALVTLGALVLMLPWDLLPLGALLLLIGLGPLTPRENSSGRSAPTALP